MQMMLGGLESPLMLNVLLTKLLQLSLLALLVNLLVVALIS